MFAAASATLSCNKSPPDPRRSIMERTQLDPRHRIDQGARHAQARVELLHAALDRERCPQPGMSLARAANARAMDLAHRAHLEGGGVGLGAGELARQRVGQPQGQGARRRVAAGDRERQDRNQAPRRKRPFDAERPGHGLPQRRVERDSGPRGRDPQEKQERDRGEPIRSDGPAQRTGCGSTTPGRPCAISCSLPSARAADAGRAAGSFASRSSSRPSSPAGVSARSVEAGCAASCRM